MLTGLPEIQAPCDPPTDILRPLCTRSFLGNHSHVAHEMLLVKALFSDPSKFRREASNKLPVDLPLGGLLP